MNEEKIFHLDLTGCKTWQTLHKQIQETFDFPDYYGQNWDAFYDLMRTEVDIDKLVIIGAYTMPADLQEELQTMYMVLDYLKSFYLDSYQKVFTYEVLN